MFRLHFLAVALVIFAVIGVQAHAANSPQFTVFLQKYLPQSTINSTVYYNASVGQDSYVIMQFSDGSYAIVNTTGGAYSFVLDNASAYTVLRPFAVVHFYPNSSTLSQLNSYMLAYEQTAMMNLTGCLQLTGLNSGLTCTVSNVCQSCQSVPICRKLLSAAASGTVNQSNASSSVTLTTANLGVIAIANFSTNYNRLNSSFQSFQSIFSGITPNNTYTNLQQLYQITQRVTNISTILPEDAIFPLPPGLGANQLAQCVSYVPGTGPWYCTDFGNSFGSYCTSPDFNTTDIYNAQTILTNLLALPISNQSIRALSLSAANKGLSIIAPSLDSQLTALINANYPRYNSTTKNATVLLAVFHNASLNASLGSLQRTFLDLASLDLSKNVSTYNASLTIDFANLSLYYLPLIAKYNTLKAVATNNTALVLQRELEYQTEPASLASLAYAQQSINDVLAAGVNSSQYAGMYTQLKAVQTGLNSVGAPLSLPSLIKSADGGIVGGILAGSNASVPAKLSAAPLYVFLITLAIAIVIIVVIYFLTFRHLSKKQRLHLNPKARRAWLMLFAVFFVIGIAVSYMTYAAAASANAFLPIDGFAAQLASHASVFIAYNGTDALFNQSIQLCAASLQQTLNGTGKAVHTIALSNYTCTSSGSAPNCFDQLLSSGTPVVVLGQSPTSSITYRGLYGQTLYAFGTAASGSSCYVNSVVKVK